MFRMRRQATISDERSSYGEHRSWCRQISSLCADGLMAEGLYSGRLSWKHFCAMHYGFVVTHT